MVAHRHHYVPKCYLNAFAVQNKHKKNRQLLMFDAIEGKCVRNAPDNVALEKDFNTIDLEGHPPDAFEQAMASVESEIGPALSRIVEAKSLADEDDRASLLNLIGLLHIRNPRSRETRRTIHGAVAKRILDIALSSPATWESQMKKAQAAGVIATDADTDYERVKRSYKPEDYAVAVANEAQIAIEMQAFDHALPSLFERKWVLVEAVEASPGFVTSDHPVSLTWSEPPPSSRPLGLRTPGTKIFFPITPRLAVVGTFEGQDGEAQFTDNEVASANGATIMNAQRQIYAERGDFRYRIDPTQPPRTASELLNDERFLRPARPTVIK